ncbi:MAG: hypothetical protein R3C18_14090 [Planctomycetaceae bacterium]
MDNDYWNDAVVEAKRNGWVAPDSDDFFEVLNETAEQSKVGPVLHAPLLAMISAMAVLLASDDKPYFWLVPIFDSIADDPELTGTEFKQSARLGSLLNQEQFSQVIAYAERFSAIAIVASLLPIQDGRRARYGAPFRYSKGYFGDLDCGLD